jgi:hypothetical protein
VLRLLRVLLFPGTPKAPSAPALGAFRVCHIGTPPDVTTNPPPQHEGVCGAGRTRTGDLQVMGLASYQLLYRAACPVWVPPHKGLSGGTSPAPRGERPAFRALQGAG